MKEVLIITDVDFWAKGAGHRMRIANLVAYLADLVTLSIVYIGILSPEAENIVASGLKASFTVLENSTLLKTADYGRKLNTYLEGRHFDVIVIEYIHNSYLLSYINNDKTKIILDAHDIVSDREIEFQKFKYKSGLFELTQEMEHHIFKAYDYVMVLSKPDKNKVQKVIGRTRTLLCPHPLVPVAHSVRKRVMKIGFIASEYLPNQDGIYFFLTNCWQQIIEKYDVQLYIYGNICKVINIQNYKNVILSGFVDDLEMVYQNVDIIINPVRFGAGLKIKNVEAIANGIPLVTTPHGAGGLEKGRNSAFIVADEPSEFISAISSLIDSQTLRKKLSDRALKFAERNFAPASCFQPLLSVVNSNNLKTG